MTATIHFLKASHGDAFIIEIKDQNNNPTIIVIDGGLPDTFRRYIKPIIKNYTKIDLLVLTHTDDDHIKGLVSFFESDLYKNIDIQEYWANCRYSVLLKSGNQVTLSSAKDFDKFLLQKEGENAEEKWNKDIIFTGSSSKLNNIEFLILSPGQEQLSLFYDKWRVEEKLSERTQAASAVVSQLKRGSIEDLAKNNFCPTRNIVDDYVNSSSIAFVMKHEDFSILFLGDARPEIIIESLQQLGYNTINNRLKVDYVKISHHGSKNNTSPELLSFLDCNHFIISTNGGSGRSKHPDREVLAWILCRNNREDNPTHLYFNYKLSEIERKAGRFLTEDECEKFNCIIHDDVIKIPI